jgi:hypothetical protein
MRMWTFVGLIVLSIGGIAVMDFRPAWGVWYWLIMTCVFGIAGISLAWYVAGEVDPPRPGMVKRQVLHWLAVLVAVALVFLMENVMQVDPVVAGLVALLILALSCMLAGIHFEWRLSVLGGVLGATFLAAILAADFFWAGLLIAVVGGAIIIATMRHRQGKRTAE